MSNWDAYSALRKQGVYPAAAVKQLGLSKGIAYRYEQQFKASVTPEEYETYRSNYSRNSEKAYLNKVASVPRTLEMIQGPPIAEGRP